MFLSQWQRTTLQWIGQNLHTAVNSVLFLTTMVVECTLCAAKIEVLQIMTAAVQVHR